MSFIYTEELNVFFAYVGKNILQTSPNKEYLWKALEICKYTALSQNQVKDKKILNAQFFNEALSIFNLTKIEQETNQSILSQFAHDLKAVFLTDPVVGALPFHLQEGLLHFKLEEKPNKFGTKHITKMLHYTTISFIAIAIYYSYKILGVWALLGIASFAVYWGARKLYQNLLIKNEEQSVLQTVQKEVKRSQQHSVVTTQTVKSSIPDIVNHWPDIKMLDKKTIIIIEQVKQQLLIFSQIYPQKQSVDNSYMEQDALKMAKEHIPTIISSIQFKQHDKDTVISTLETMNRLLQSHVTDLLWEEKRDLSVKHRYWMNKLAEKNSFEDLVKEIRN